MVRTDVRRRQLIYPCSVRRNSYEYVVTKSWSAITVVGGVLRATEYQPTALRHTPRMGKGGLGLKRKPAVVLGFLLLGAYLLLGGGGGGGESSKQEFAKAIERGGGVESEKADLEGENKRLRDQQADMSAQMLVMQVRPRCLSLSRRPPPPPPPLLRPAAAERLATGRHSAR